MVGTLKNNKIFVDHKVSTTQRGQQSKRDQIYLTIFFLSNHGMWIEKKGQFSHLTKICPAPTSKRDADTF